MRAVVGRSRLGPSLDAVDAAPPRASASKYRHQRPNLWSRCGQRGSARSDRTRNQCLGYARPFWSLVDGGETQRFNLPVQRQFSPGINGTHYCPMALTRLTYCVACAIGDIRLLIPPLSFKRVVKAGFDLIRQASVDNPAIAIRLLQTCARLTPELQDDEQRHEIHDLVEAVHDVGPPSHWPTRPPEWPGP